MLGFFLLASVALSQAAIAPGGQEDAQDFTINAAEKLQLLQELQDEELAKELEQVLGSMSDEQLARFETLLSKDLDTETELKMIQDELAELGMEPDDVTDLLDLATMMSKFLNRVPEVSSRMDLGEDDYSLEDHVKLYLLGLPNRLGPLGFIALHSVLQADEEIVDVKIEDFQPNPVAAEASVGAITPLGDLIARKKMQAQKAKLAAINAAPVPKFGGDIVAEILARRKRSMH